MECVVYKRRIVLGGIASATILASGVITAGTALAATTPQLPVTLPATASSLIPGALMSQVPGLANALQAAPMSKFNVTGAVPGVSGVAGAARGLQPASLTQRGLSNVPTRSSLLGQGATGVTGNAVPAAASIPGLGSAMGAVGKISGNPGSATSGISSFGDLIGVAPDLSPVAGLVGTGF
jgi:hypothetical protein